MCDAPSFQVSLSIAVRLLPPRDRSAEEDDDESRRETGDDAGDDDDDDAALARLAAAVGRAARAAGAAPRDHAGFARGRRTPRAADVTL